MIKKSFLLGLVFTLVCSALSIANATEFTNKSSFTRRLVEYPVSSSQSVADRANKLYGGSGYSGGVQDPLMNGALGGYYNMMQGVTGGAYDAREMQRMQTDYVKQQMETTKSEE